MGPDEHLPDAHLPDGSDLDEEARVDAEEAVPGDEAVPGEQPAQDEAPGDTGDPEVDPEADAEARAERPSSSQKPRRTRAAGSAAQNKTAQNKTAQNKTAQNKTAQNKTAQNRAGKTKPTQNRAGQKKPGQQQAAAKPMNFTLPQFELRAWLTTGRDGVRTLLARPLTSFHLVVFLAAILTVFGLIMVQSASSVEGYSQDHSAYGSFFTQTLFAILGWAAFYAVLRLPLRFFRRFATFGVVASVVLLMLVLIPEVGVKVDGARRWFEVGGISIQPSELAKLALCVWGAHVLALRRGGTGWGKDLMLPLVPVAMLMSGLIIAEPNLSTTVIIVIITAALLWFAGLPGRVFLSFLAFFVVLAVVFAFSADYRAARVFSFLGSSDPLGSGYQAMQAKFALANGGVFGVGLGGSTAKWNYLPNAHNDFIFAIIVEETGLIGGLFVIGLFLLLGYVGMRIALRSADPFLRLLTGAITVLITAQMFINVGYVVGLLPVTGIQLPLLSQGGTSMLTMLTMLGLLATAARHEPQAVVALAGRSGRGLSGVLRLAPPAAYQPRTVDVASDRLARRRSAGRVPESARTRRSPNRPARTPVPRETVGRARARTQRSDEIHYSARQARGRIPTDPRRSTQGYGRTADSPRRTEYRHR